MAFKEFRYKVELTYLNNKEEVNITTESINSICIDSDYFGKKAFPVVYIDINLKNTIYNKMLSNIEKGTVIFSLSKFAVSEDNSTTETKVIKDEFLYFFDNTNLSEDSMQSEDKDEYEEYKNLRMGLVNLSILNMCKTMNNDVVSGSMSNILFYYLRYAKKIIMEPLSNNNTFSNLIIPPIPTLNKLLKYLNNISSFYNSSYRFFIDLNKTAYLLSNSGKSVETKDSTYSSIIMKVVPDDNADNKYKEPGIEIDSQNKCYILYLNSINTTLTENLYKDKEISKIVSISTNGSVKESTLDTCKNSKGDRVSIIRTFNENNSEVSSLSNLYENSKIMMNITKEGVDCSLITPEKSINITNENSTKYYGKYILVGKQELYIMNDASNFTCNTILKLMKVKS